MGFCKQIKENFIPPCLDGPLTRVHLKNFHLNLSEIPAKSSEIPPRRAGSLLIRTHYVFIGDSKVRSHLGEPAHLTWPAHLHMDSPQNS